MEPNKYKGQDGREEDESMSRSISTSSSSSSLRQIRQNSATSFLSPTLENSSVFHNMDEDQRSQFYSDRRQALLQGIEAAHTLIQRFQAFNTNEFELNITPEQLNTNDPSTSSSTTSATTATTTTTTATESSSASASDGQIEVTRPAPLSVLHLGPLPSAIDQASKSQLLNQRFIRVIEQLNNLRTRITSSTSRILVTGDLNAGKSSLVNALLRQQEFMPTDQQPCTSSFCEVADAHRLNNDQEEVHAVLEGQIEAYENSRDPTSFRIFPLSQLNQLVASQRDHLYEDDESDQEIEIDEGIGEEEQVVTQKPNRPNDNPHYALIKAFVKPQPSSSGGGGDDDNDNDDNYYNNNNNNNDKHVLTNIPPSFDRKGKGKKRQDDDDDDDDNINNSNDHEDHEQEDYYGDNKKSFIHNAKSTHALSLIDSPGLNVSNIKTTSVFARQSEIDIVIFVVSAENHFTLSAEDFLRAASLEKPYIFIVVNKWSTIRDRRFAAKRIGEQIKRLSPDTYRLRDELVHFVDAESFMSQQASSSSSPADLSSADQAFKRLESSLRSFVLLKRAQSKLSPSQNYLRKLHSDLDALTQYNLSFAQDRHRQLNDRLHVIVPQNDKLVATSNKVNDAISDVIESSVDSVRQETYSYLDESAKYIAQGQLRPNTRHQLPPFTSIFDIYDWSRHVLDTFFLSIQDDVRFCEGQARNQTSEAVESISIDLANVYLPPSQLQSATANEDVTTSSSSSTSAPPPPRRQFQPNKMFRNRPALGLSSENIDLELSDLFDIGQFTLVVTNAKNEVKKYVGLSTSEQDSGEDKQLSMVSWSAGGILAAYAGRTLGIKALANNIGRIVDILSSETARTWAVPIIAFAGLGFVGFIIVDLPRAVPVNLGRKIHSSLLADRSLANLAAVTASANNNQQQPQIPQNFATQQANRISYQTRRVLTVAGDDLRIMFRSALEQSTQERRSLEGDASVAAAALTWLKDFQDDIRHESKRVNSINLEEATV